VGSENRGWRSLGQAVPVRGDPDQFTKFVLNAEFGHSITSENLVDPITPPPELISPTLLGDIAERVATDFLAHRDSYVSDVARLRMDVP